MRKLINGNSINNDIDGTDFDDKIYGKGGNDKLVGHHGDDVISGGAGKDVIFGGQDFDTLLGGAGADKFMFNKLAAKDADQIKDFAHGSDKIGLDFRIFDELDKGRLDGDNFRAGTSAKDADDHVIYNETNGRLYYDDDGKGGHKQVLLAELTNHAHLTSDDVFLF